MADKDSPKRFPSNHELYLQSLREKQDEPQADEVLAPYAVEDNDVSGFVGVSPEYMTYSNDTEKPLRADEGVLAEVEREAVEESASPVLQPGQPPKTESTQTPTSPAPPAPKGNAKKSGESDSDSE